MEPIDKTLNIDDEDSKSLESLGNPIDLDESMKNRTHSESKTSIYSTQPTSPVVLAAEFELIAFSSDDDGNPFNWSGAKKAWIMFVVIVTVLNSTIGSSLAANIAAYIADDWHITNKSLLILPTSMYLVGYIIGPLFWGPLSEHYGRKRVTIIAFALFTVFTLAAALAPNFAGLVVFRFLAGVGAACSITVSGGICADLYRSHQARGRAMALFMASTTFGPCTGPIVSGYISPISWRWSFWAGLVLAGVTTVLLLTIPESYAPIILLRRAKKMRRATGNEHIRAPLELEKSGLGHVAKVVLTRPLRMFIFEAIIFFSCMYLSVAYAIFYMFFQAFPIIYNGIYHFSAGEEGLAFLPIGVGAVIACCIYLIWDAVTRRASARGALWMRKEEMRRLPLACAAGPFLVAAAFWMGWSARPSVHWIVPVLSGIPFGIGFLLLFMALLNYIVDAYKVFAASAMAAAGTSRSIWGAVLPFAAKPMYEKLGVQWACSLIGFFCLALSAIPFFFVWKGETLRARSKFCQYLLQKEREEEEKELAKQGGRDTEDRTHDVLGKI